MSKHIGISMKKGKQRYIQLVAQLGTILLVMVGVLLLGFCFMLEYNMENNITMIREMQMDMLNGKQQLADILLRQYSHSVLTLAVDNEFRMLVAEDADIDAREAASMDILRLLRRYLDTYGDAVNICYVSRNGRRHNSNRPDKGDRGFGYRNDAVGEQLLEKIVATCAQTPGIHYFADNRKQEYLGMGFHEAFRVQDLYTHEYYGTLIVTFSQDALKQTMTSALQDGQNSVEMVLVTRQGELLVGKDEEKIGTLFQAEAITNDADLSVAFKNIGKNGLQIYSILDLRPYTQRFRDIQWMFAMAAILVAGLYLAASYVLMNRSNRSLKELMQGINQMKEGGKSITLKVSSNDEFGYLIDEFNSLSQRLRKMARSVQRSNDAKLRAVELHHRTIIKTLQGQINFHFLANTINSISSVAIANNDYRVPRLLKALSNTLRYTFESESEQTTIRNEVSWLQDYLMLSQERNGKQFSFSILVDENVQEDIVPKLLIQPFVENSIAHGFAGRTYGGILKIRIRRFRRDSIAISISDNGRGIPAEKAEEIKKMFRYGEDCESIGVGLNNVVKRIFLYYQGAHLYLRTSPSGTQIDLVLPKWNR